MFNLSEVHSWPSSLFYLIVARPAGAPHLVRYLTGSCDKGACLPLDLFPTVLIQTIYVGPRQMVVTIRMIGIGLLHPLWRIDSRPIRLLKRGVKERRKL